MMPMFTCFVLFSAFLMLNQSEKFQNTTSRYTIACFLSLFILNHSHTQINIPPIWHQINFYRLQLMCTRKAFLRDNCDRDTKAATPAFAEKNFTEARESLPDAQHYKL